ncbi:MAG: hypothetical protein JRI58_09310 [Deltaproteobacteria bacterium]|nr:hypothetical protein [Deltaproteobacteria bacterium]MBW2074928.1 hypothetical protein [Deltaproteobacteria bacterium]RLB80591.1 MAG: hypothetical protein DRH17_11540 [Deltaproteobacteria bacterium]
MPLTGKHDAKIIKLVTEEAEKFQAKVKQIDLEKQILDIDCPNENKVECAIAIQKILDEQYAK